MVFAPADIERAALDLELLSYQTASWVHIKTGAAGDPADTDVHIAYKVLASANQRVGVPDPVVLCVHDVHQSGQIFAPLALALAEQGLLVAALSLAWHGSGRWFSYAGRPQAEESLARYTHQVRLVMQALGDRPLILVGQGLLGGVLAQTVAMQHAAVAGIALLGGCLPPVVPKIWERMYPAPVRRWWQLPPAQPSASALPPPDRAFIQTWWLDEAAHEEAYHIWPYLYAEPAQLAQDVARLSGQPFSPPTTRALILAGERDAIITPAVLQATAAAYQVAPIIIPEAPHLLVRSRPLPAVIDHLGAFCHSLVTHQTSKRRTTR